MRHSFASMVGMATTFFQYFLFHVMASRFLSFPEDEIGQLLKEKGLKCIIKQLSNSVFVICKIINISARAICLAFGSAITLTATLIIPHMPKTLSNNCLLSPIRFRHFFTFL